jgi:hypothetical protein
MKVPAVEAVPVVDEPYNRPPKIKTLPLVKEAAALDVELASTGKEIAAARLRYRRFN